MACPDDRSRTNLAQSGVALKLHDSRVLLSFDLLADHVQMIVLFIAGADQNAS
jgi:hypothetical protein